MLQIRKASERGHAEHGWLNSHHTFSFAGYHDASQMGWGPLRVINDDTVAPGAGFPTHSHQDMEIISYVLDGALEHKDTIGTGSMIVPGDVQMMTAGSGIAHSEYNASKTAPVHFLQIWVIPAQAGLRPNYQQRRFADAEKRGQWRLVVSPDGRDGSLQIHQDAAIYSALLDGDERIEWALAAWRSGYLHVARGSVTLNGQALQAGDGVKVQDEPRLLLAGGRQAELLWFDLPPH